MLIEQVYRLYPQRQTLDKLAEEHYDIEMFTPKQLKQLHHVCVTTTKAFFDISENQYERMGEDEYERREKQSDLAVEYREFIEENWMEALI